MSLSMSRIDFPYITIKKFFSLCDVMYIHNLNSMIELDKILNNANLAIGFKYCYQINYILNLNLKQQ